VKGIFLLFYSSKRYQQSFKEIEIKSLISELKSYSLPTINEINQLTGDLCNKVMDFIKREEEEISRQVRLQITEEILNVHSQVQQPQNNISNSELNPSSLLYNGDKIEENKNSNNQNIISIQGFYQALDRNNGNYNLNEELRKLLVMTV